MEEPIRACATCRWYCDKGRRSHANFPGECRYNPPAFHSRYDHGAKWPGVRPDYWCRLYERKPPYED